MTSEAAIGSRLPHVVLTTRAGDTFTYADIWQREQLLLVLLPAEATTSWNALETSLEEVRRRLREMETVLVISSQAAAGLEPPLALVVDRWGEITHAADLSIEHDRTTPDAATLLTWVEATLHRCPECEGEAR